MNILKRLFYKTLDKYEIIKNCKKIKECLYGYKINNLEIKIILFYFPNAEIMHLGDHLFFEPLMNLLKKDGYKIYILPSRQMEFYFKNLGYEIFSRKINPDLIITRTEFLRDLKNKKNILLYDYLNIKLKEKLCVDIVEKVYSFLDKTKKIDKENIKINYLILNKIILNEITCKFNLKKHEKYIIYNNYLDSGRMLNIFLNYEEKLEKKVMELKKKGYLVLHLGSNKDKLNDKRIYNFIDKDLRGKTTIEDLFYIVALDNIKINVGFDAFIMHLFFIKNKKNYIFLRNKITNKRKECIIKYFNPPYIIEEEKINYIKE